MMSDSILVYSTDVGRIKEKKASVIRPKGDGVVRIQKQTSGRKGAGVSVITGMIEIQGEKRDLLKQWLEQKGFTVKLSGG